MFHWQWLDQVLTFSSANPKVLPQQARVLRHHDQVWISIGGMIYVLKSIHPQTHEATDMALDIKSPMSGTLKQILVKTGDSVSEGQTLMLMEAMKMQIPIRALRAAKVKKICGGVGDFVPEASTLVELESIDE